MAKGSAKAFQKSIDNWVKQANEDASYIYRESVRGVVDSLQQNMPHDTGNLKRSVTVGMSPHMPLGGNDEQFADPTAANDAVINNVTIDDDHVFVGIRAAYGPKDNFGHIGSDGTNRAGKHWFERTAAAFKGIARRVATTRRRRVK